MANSPSSYYSALDATNSASSCAIDPNTSIVHTTEPSSLSTEHDGFNWGYILALVPLVIVFGLVLFQSRYTYEEPSQRQPMRKKKVNLNRVMTSHAPHSSADSSSCRKTIDRHDQDHISLPLHVQERRQWDASSTNTSVVIVEDNVTSDSECSISASPFVLATPGPKHFRQHVVMSRIMVENEWSGANGSNNESDVTRSSSLQDFRHDLHHEDDPYKVTRSSEYSF